MPYSTNFSFHFVEIRPGQFRYGKLITALTAGVFRIGRRMKVDYEKTVATWKVRPRFEMLTQRTSSIASVLVGTDNRIYAYVNNGTSIRYATMSKDWDSKSRVHVIGSFPGSGRREFVSKFHPQRGIAAREWSLVIEKKYERDFRDAMNEAMDKARVDSGHAM